MEDVMNDVFISESKNLLYVCYIELDRQSKSTLISLHINNVIMWRLQTLKNGYLDTSPMIQSILYSPTMIESIDIIKTQHNSVKNSGILYEVGLYYIEPNTPNSFILTLPEVKSVIDTFAKYPKLYDIEIYKNGLEIQFQS